jgi:hypothetical protein
MTVRTVRRRRSRTSFAVRVRTFWVVAILVALAFAGVAIAFAGAPQLRIKQVHATVPAGSPVSVADVLAAARVQPAANLWLLDTGAIRRRVDALPYVLTTGVHRAQFPEPTVAIDVTIRVPTGCVRTGGRTVTIDATARVVQTGCASPQLAAVDAGSDPAPAPGERLTTPDIERLLDDAKTIAATVPVRIVRRDRFGGLEAVDGDGVILRFGADDDLASKLALIDPIRRSEAGAKKLRAIDLRAPDTPVVEFP